jgi:hypothetical protein
MCTNLENNKEQPISLKNEILPVSWQRISEITRIIAGIVQLLTTEWNSINACQDNLDLFVILLGECMVP